MKNLKQYYTIQEVSNIVGVLSSTIRHWEKALDKKLHYKTKNRRGKQERLFNEENIKLLKKIYKWRYNEDIGLNGVKRKLKV